MLKRSPKSKIFAVTGVLLAVVAAFIAIDALTTLNSLAHNHGRREKYFILKHDVSKSSKLSSNDFSVHEMFSGDAPQNAIRKSSLILKSFANSDLLEETILTSNMISADIGKTLDGDNRIIFIPTKDVLEKSYLSTTDLLSASPDGFGVDVLATHARILFDLSPNNTRQSESNNPGYFLEVTQEEASSITQALSQSDVRFALVSSGG